jgi:ABC-type multidrug transport system fused ATPase/permease subunit
MALPFASFLFKLTMKVMKWVKKRFWVTDSGLALLSLIPLGFCSIGFFGFMLGELGPMDVTAHLVLAMICLAPSLLIFLIINYFEEKHCKKHYRRQLMRRQQKTYKKNVPFNNRIAEDVSGHLEASSDQKKKSALSALFSMPLSPDSFRAVTDEAIDETLEKLKAEKSKKRGAA